MKDLEYATAKGRSYGPVWRVDIGLSGKTKLMMWKMKNNRDIQLATYDFGKFIKRLANKEVLSFKEKKFECSFYKGYKKDSTIGKYLYPNKSMQSIDGYGSSTLYINSGNQSEGRKLTISMLNLQEKNKLTLNKVMNVEEVCSLTLPKKKLEIEGIQVEKKKIYLCVTPASASGDKGKFPQEIISIKR